jgi:polyhydroxyalkanoate synthesis repressor PhaR
LRQEAWTVAHRPVVIKKYGNRRLYDTSASRYVNLDALAAMVRNGTEVKVVDAETGEDLTRVTLTQIIVEDAKGQSTGLPLELLRQLIMASDRVRQEFMSWYLKSAFESYQKVQSAVQSGLEQLGTAAFSPLEVMKSFLPGGDGQPADKRELERLRRRVAELEAKSRTRKRKTSKARAHA